MKKSEAGLIEARETVERIEAMDAQLATRLVAAEHREVADAVNAKAAIADARTAEFNERWARDFEQISGEMIALLQTGFDASEAAGDHQWERDNATRWKGVAETDLNEREVCIELGKASLTTLEQKIKGFPCKFMFRA